MVQKPQESSLNSNADQNKIFHFCHDTTWGVNIKDTPAQAARYDDMLQVKKNTEAEVN